MNNKLLILILLLLPYQTIAQSQTRLIVRVDDMGSSHAANEAIRRACLEGIGSSIEVMVPTPWFPEAVRMLREMPQVDVGIHLTLTSEWTEIKWGPVTHAPSITDELGYFYPMIWPNPNLPADRSLEQHNWDLREMEQELRKQIEIAKAQIPQLSHMSAHMGCSNINEATRALYRRLGKEYGLDIHTEDHQVQRISDWGGQDRSAKEKRKLLIEKLKALTPGNWMIVLHPATDTPEQQSISHPGYEQVAYDRQGDLDILLHKKVRKTIEKLGIELIGYPGLE